MKHPTISQWKQMVAKVSYCHCYFFVYHGNPINLGVVHHFNPTCLITVSLLVDEAKPAAKVKTARKLAPKAEPSGDEASDDQSVEANGSEGELLSLLFFCLPR
jgi:hypothetical protein